MKRVVAADYTLDEYQRHLASLFGFHEPLERSAMLIPNTEAGEHCFRRSDALRDDLIALGWPPNTIAVLRRCTELPELTSAGIWGYCYVMLGSMLGARIIAGQLDNLPGAQVAMRFYRGDDAENGRRWTSFCDDLERYGAADVAAICATANATLDAYAAWLQTDVNERRR